MLFPRPSSSKIWTAKLANRDPNAVVGLTQRQLPAILCVSDHEKNGFLERSEYFQVKVRVFYHDKCFDGACSASLFARFHRECIASGSEYEFCGLVHRAGSLFNEADFTGDENAIVDFKYSPSPAITWWFDHHLSAFLTPQDHQHFLDGQRDPKTRQRKFYDPEYISCTSFLAHVAATHFGFNPVPVSDMIRWADIVDGALYESPQSAVEMAEPAMKLTMAIESTQSTEFVPKLIPLLTSMTFAEILEQPFVAELLPELMERHRYALRLIRERSTCEAGTIYFDITDHPLEGYNKFIPYYVHPDATYSVGISRSSFRTKIAVGSNPWTKVKPENMVNLATICERYGGGGHARVGAISFPREKDDLARQAAAEIVAELRAHTAR